MKKKIVVFGEFTNKKMKDLEENFNVYRTSDQKIFENLVVDCDAILSRHPKINEALLGKATKLKLISQATTGCDNIDIDSCTKHNVQVCNSPRLNEEVSDIALFHILNAMRKCDKANSLLKQGLWYNDSCVGMEMTNKNLFIIGYGRIGQTIARKARVLGVNIYATSPHFTKDDVKDDYIVKSISFKEGIEIADIVVLSLPLNDKTYHIINEDVLKSMKKTSVLINISRGGLVDSEALIKALNTGEINYASMDVFEGEPLSKDNKALSVENLYLTPHIGSFIFATRDRMQQDAIENIFDYFDNKDVRFKVNKIN